jgi:Fe-S-cluster containining protein
MPVALHRLYIPNSQNFGDSGNGDAQAAGEDRFRGWQQAFAGRKPRRDELPPGVNLCQYCSAKCCRYLALEIDRPTTARQFDFLVWFLLHRDVAVFVERGRWFVLFRTPCTKLLPDGRCGIYAVRPQICRRYSTKRCEYEDDWVYDKLFELPEQVQEYAEVMLSHRGKVRRGPRLLVEGVPSPDCEPGRDQRSPRKGARSR